MKMYKTMVMLSTMDVIFYDAQRQGRISFYMTNMGEEAAQVGSAAATDQGDVMYAQYRETGAIMWRGVTLDEIADQCFSTEFGHGKGRQMPVHYGSKAANLQTISSPLATQIPQAVGAAYALKMEKRQNCVICYFGDGAASEGDFHAALNFSATLECPVIFFCRNNGIAISTPAHEQYRGDGIIGRARGYGIKSIRVDGNDIFAVYEATMAARKYAIESQRPVFVEAMSYRGGHHSTSDDSTRYRPVEEILGWKEKNNPISRLRFFLEDRGIWNNELDTNLKIECRKQVLKAISRAESCLKPPIESVFTDVYDTLTSNLEEQKMELMEHLDKYPSEYKMELYSQNKGK